SQKTFEEANSPRDLIYVLSELGSAFVWTGDYQKAEDYSEQSLALAASKPTKPGVSGIADEYGIANAWYNLGEVSNWQGDYAAAIASFQKSLALWEMLNHGGLLYRARVVDVLISIGIAYRKMGDHLKALKHCYQALGLAKTMTDKVRLAGVLVSIGVLYIE